MKRKTTIAYCYIATPLGELLAVQGEKGLEKLFFPRGRTRVLPDSGWVEDSVCLREASDEILAYFNRELKSFSITIDPEGTPFQQSVWHALMTIPPGETVSYRDVAEQIGNPKACRAVGGAVGKNPIPIIIPCHRVIGADGSLTGFASGLDIKRYLLNLEGICC